MVEEANPLFGMTKAQDEIFARLLSDIWQSGDWTDEHDEILAQWREARGEEAYDEWQWWVGYVDADSYGEEAPSRNKAIDLGQRDYSDEGKFQIIEACLWNDSVKDGDEISAFARTRNHEIVTLK